MGETNPGPPESELELFCKEAGYGSPPPVRSRAGQTDSDLLEARYAWWQDRKKRPLRNLATAIPDAVKQETSSDAPGGDSLDWLPPTQGGPGADLSSTATPPPTHRKRWDTRRRKRQTAGRPAPTALFAHWRTGGHSVPMLVQNPHSSDHIDEESGTHPMGDDASGRNKRRGWPRLQTVRPMPSSAYDLDPTQTISQRDPSEGHPLGLRELPAAARSGGLLSSTQYVQGRARSHTPTRSTPWHRTVLAGRPY